MKELNVKMRGHYNYYGITFNSRGVLNFYEQVKRRLYKWLNRRGGKQVWIWEKFTIIVTNWLPLLRPNIFHSYVSANPILEEPYAGKPLVRVCGCFGRSCATIFWPIRFCFGRSCARGEIK